LKNLSASAGVESLIVPSTGQVVKALKSAISTIADNIAQGYAIDAVIPADTTPSGVSITVVNRPDAVVRAHPITAVP
jgi:hypothetical protein